MSKLRLSGGLLMLLALAVVAGTLTFLSVDSLFKRDVALWGLVATMLAGIAAGIFDWFTRETPAEIRGWSRFSNPRWLARLGMSILFGLGIALFAQSFVSPTDSDLIRSDLGRVDARVQGIHRDTRTLLERTTPAPWAVFENITGLWGEANGDCRVVYRFERIDHGLIVELASHEPDMADYRMTASIHTGGHGNALRATLRSSTAADERDGDGLLFAYFNDGLIERLDWLNETRSAAGLRETGELHWALAVVGRGSAAQLAGNQPEELDREDLETAISALDLTNPVQAERGRSLLAWSSRVGDAAD